MESRIYIYLSLQSSFFLIRPVSFNQTDKGDYVAFVSTKEDLSFLMKVNCYEPSLNLLYYLYVQEKKKT